MILCKWNIKIKQGQFLNVSDFFKYCLTVRLNFLGHLLLEEKEGWVMGVKICVAKTAHFH